jgi:hypothetical protein
MLFSKLLYDCQTTEIDVTINENQPLVFFFFFISIDLKTDFHPHIIKLYDNLIIIYYIVSRFSNVSSTKKICIICY